MSPVTSGDAPGGEAGRSTRARAAFRRHAALFVIGSVTLSVGNYFVGSGWWAFWPLIAWSALFMIHYLRYKVATVDERWVDARVTDLRIKSYDRDHIENIAAHGPGAAAREDDA